MLESPKYTWNPGTRLATLVADIIFDTPVTGYVVHQEFAMLAPTGHLVCKRGLVWDFGSGPAIDTPEVVAASLPHDVFYSMIRDKKIPASERKAADKYFRRMLEEWGVGWFRRNYMYLGVRYGHAVWSKLFK